MVAATLSTSRGQVAGAAGLGPVATSATLTSRSSTLSPPPRSMDSAVARCPESSLTSCTEALQDVRFPFVRRRGRAHCLPRAESSQLVRGDHDLKAFVVLVAAAEGGKQPPGRHIARGALRGQPDGRAAQFVGAVGQPPQQALLDAPAERPAA